MTPDPDTVGPNDWASLALERMRSSGYRHVPVVDDGIVVGIVSLRDLYAAAKRELEEDLQQREAFIFDTGYGTGCRRLPSVDRGARRPIVRAQSDHPRTTSDAPVAPRRANLPAQPDLRFPGLPARRWPVGHRRAHRRHHDLSLRQPGPRRTYAGRSAAADVDPHATRRGHKGGSTQG